MYLSSINNHSLSGLIDSAFNKNKDCFNYMPLAMKIVAISPLLFLGYKLVKHTIKATTLPTCEKIELKEARATEPACEKTESKPTEQTSDLQILKQSNSNYGYCGEVSFKIAGLKLGQYVSQYKVRQIASPDIKQCKQKAQLLLGINDAKTAERMGLKYEKWNSKNTEEFLTWVKKQVSQGFTVSIGLFANQYEFEESKDPRAGDNEYDHIVTVLKVENDKLIITDHGLYGNEGEEAYTFELPFNECAKTRTEANKEGGPIYSICSDGPKYAIAIQGICNPEQQLLPVSIKIDKINEPDIKDNTNKIPVPEDITLTVTVQGLEKEKEYYLYAYDDFNSVPKKDFNAPENAPKNNLMNNKIKICKIDGEYKIKYTIKSDQTVIFRAVAADANTTTGK